MSKNFKITLKIIKSILILKIKNFLFSFQLSTLVLFLEIEAIGNFYMK